MARSRPTYDSIKDEESVTLLDAKVPTRRKKRRGVLIILLSTVIAVTVFILAKSWAKVSTAGPKKNVILMISDGFGPASETYARSYYQHVHKLPYNFTTPLDEIFVGTSRTRSSDSLVTDSAAGATAFACAMKSYNAAIAVDPSKVACGTVLEAAKSIGYTTGLVVTSRITHATPACFSAHVVHRDLEDIIARHQIGDYVLGRQVDILLGGGRCFFLPQNVAGSCRQDDVDVLEMADNNGFSYIQSRKEFDKLKPKQKLPLLGLFTLDHMSYEIDRDRKLEPSLAEMTTKTLQMLTHATGNSDKGFFLMVEGSRIDMAAHSNDPASHVYDILAYHETIKVVKAYVKSHPGTIMISVSDHETGGLSLARQNSEDYPKYRWLPEVITRVKKSAYILSTELLAYEGRDKERFIREKILFGGLGIENPTEEEIKWLMEKNDQLAIEFYLGTMVSKRAEIGWATHGHSGLDVNLYAYGAGTESLRGNVENTNIGDFISQYLELNLEKITNQLNKNNASFHMVDEETLNRLTANDLMHYHHHH